MNNHEFDQNSIDRIKNLLILKGKCLRYNDEHVKFLIKNKALDGSMEFSTFFSSMSDAIDVILVSFINEEVSEFHDNRFPLGEIIYNAISNNTDGTNNPHLAQASIDCLDIFRNRIDFYIGSSFIDFSVSSYSVFEFWVCKMYEDLREKKERKNKKLTSIEGIIRDGLDGICIDSTVIEEMATKILKKHMSYISGSEKIEFILSVLDDNYRRNKKDDIDAISFYRNKRNSIHNMGIHCGKSTSFSDSDGNIISMQQGRAVYCKDHSSNIRLCNELVEIYKEIISSLVPTFPDVWSRSVMVKT